jgi:putative DNA primase/helicase
MLRHAGKKMDVGAELRMVNIPALVDKNGVFDTCHTFSGGGDFAKHLESAVNHSYGTAGRKFLAHITGMDDLRESINLRRREFIERLPENADGQIHRVAMRFALLAAAGELAVEAGALSIQSGEATAAVARIFDEWLESWGGTGAKEDRNALEQLAHFLSVNDARFARVYVVAGGRKFLDETKTVQNLAGYKFIHAETYHFQSTDGMSQLASLGDDFVEHVEYAVIPSVFRMEACRDLNYQTVQSLLAERGWLQIPEPGKYVSRNISIPGKGRTPLYRFNPGVFGMDSDGHTAKEAAPRREPDRAAVITLFTAYANDMPIVDLVAGLGLRDEADAGALLFKLGFNSYTYVADGIRRVTLPPSGGDAWDN